MTHIYLIHKSISNIIDIDLLSEEYLQSIVDGHDIKSMSLKDYQRLYNLGYASEYIDYYIKFF